jgi:hypothetical protein
MTQRGLRLIATAALVLGSAVAFFAGGHRASDCYLNRPGQPSTNVYWIIAIGVGAGVAAATLVGLQTRPWLRMLVALTLGVVAFGASVYWDLLSWIGHCD